MTVNIVAVTNLNPRTETVIGNLPNFSRATEWLADCGLQKEEDSNKWLIASHTRTSRLNTSLNPETIIYITPRLTPPGSPNNPTNPQSSGLRNFIPRTEHTPTETHLSNHISERDTYLTTDLVVLNTNNVEVTTLNPGSMYWVDLIQTSINTRGEITNNRYRGLLKIIGNIGDSSALVAAPDLLGSAPYGALFTVEDYMRQRNRVVYHYVNSGSTIVEETYTINYITEVVNIDIRPSTIHTILEGGEDDDYDEDEESFF